MPKTNANNIDEEYRCGGPGCDGECCKPVSESDACTESPVMRCICNRGTQGCMKQHAVRESDGKYSDIVSDGGLDPRNTA